MKARKCRTCRQVKDAAEFASPRARRCDECTGKAAAQSRCCICEEAVPLSPKGEARKVCDKPECKRDAKVRAGRIMNVKKWAGYVRPKTKVCPWCDREKPRTIEHFSPKGRGQDGEVTAFDHVCKPCRAAVHMDRYRNDPQYRARALQNARDRSARIAARRAADPAFDEEMRSKQRAWAAGLNRKPKPEAPVSPTWTRIDPLQALLVDVYEGRLCTSWEGLRSALAVEEFWGISEDAVERRLFAYRNGESGWAEIERIEMVYLALDERERFDEDFGDAELLTWSEKRVFHNQERQVS